MEYKKKIKHVSDKEIEEIKEITGKGGYGTYYDNIAKLLDGRNRSGYRNACFLGYLYRLYLYYDSEKELSDEGYMFIATAKVEKDMEITYKVQQRILNLMKKVGLVNVIVEKEESTRYLKVNVAKLKEYLLLPIDEIKTERIEDEEKRIVRKEIYAKNKMEGVLILLNEHINSIGETMNKDEIQKLAIHICGLKSSEQKKYLKDLKTVFSSQWKSTVS